MTPGDSQASERRLELSPGVHPRATRGTPLPGLLTRAVLSLRLLRDTGTWIIPNQLLACSYPRRARLRRALATHGITTVVNLHIRPHDPAYLREAGLSQLHLPVPDFTPPTPNQLAAGVLAIAAALARGELVAVHCGAGLGRTGTLVACYLVSTGASPTEAIGQVRRLRPGSIETKAQEAAVHAFRIASTADDRRL